MGPLKGIKVIEMAGIGPVPFCGMMLADHGAEVIRVERPSEPTDLADPLNRSRKIVMIDAKSPEGLVELRELVRTADVFIEGYRPGVMERLGAGPDVLLADNSNLVYARMTGWGQYGPYAPYAGHDINYIALSGVLHAIGRKDQRPVPPLNLVGDFGGGAMMLSFAIVSALLAVRSGGDGQVIDCAMTDGSALLNTLTYRLMAEGNWRDRRGVNLLDSGAHFYDTYECSDGRWIAVGAIEAPFYAELRRRLGIEHDCAFDDQNNPTQWDSMRSGLAKIFITRTRDDWCTILAECDACFAPVLSLTEAPEHPHNRARGTFTSLGGVLQPAPAPRYSATPCDYPRLPVPMRTSKS